MLAIHEISAEFVPIIGAEARIDIIDWHGKRAVCKARIPKTYRNEKLDHWLRTKRTREEAEILHRAKLLGVDCPALYFADPEKTELVMEYVPLARFPLPSSMSKQGSLRVSGCAGTTKR